MNMEIKRVHSSSAYVTSGNRTGFMMSVAKIPAVEPLPLFVCDSCSERSDGTFSQSETGRFSEKQLCLW